MGKDITFGQLRRERWKDDGRVAHDEGQSQFVENIALFIAVPF
jgi:hypothetical protein